MKRVIDPKLLKSVKPAINPKFLQDPLFLAVLAEGLAIQDRFSAEPIYAKTGKGYLKSAGVEELKMIKSASSKKNASPRRKPPD